MDCYRKLKKLLLRHRVRFLPSVYPPEIFEEVLDRFLFGMPFYTDKNCNSFARYYYFGGGLELDFLVGEKGASLVAFWTRSAKIRGEKLFAVSYGVNERLYGRHLPFKEVYYELTVINNLSFRARFKGGYPYSSLALKYFPYLFPLEFITVLEIPSDINPSIVPSVTEELLNAEGGFTAFFPKNLLMVAKKLYFGYSSRGLSVELRPVKVFWGNFENSARMWNWLHRKGFHNEVYLLWEGRLWKV